MNPSNALEQVVQKIDPHAKLLAAWALKGGISAQMTALEVTMGDGARRKLILRQPGVRARPHNPHAARDEFRILQRVQALGVKTQTPYLLDESGEIFPEPYWVVAYIEGAPDYAPVDVHDYATQVATQLAKLHGVVGAHDLAFLPKQAPRLAEMIKRRPPTLDDSLQEGRIRAVLEAVWPLPERGNATQVCVAFNNDTLLHGDFWPGNLLWQAGKLVAVIDWEDAEVGNPLADVAITRLDLLWIVGQRGHAHLYAALSSVDASAARAWILGNCPIGTWWRRCARHHNWPNGRRIGRRWDATTLLKQRCGRRMGGLWRRRWRSCKRL